MLLWQCRAPIRHRVPGGWGLPWTPGSCSSACWTVECREPFLSIHLINKYDHKKAQIKNSSIFVIVAWLARERHFEQEAAVSEKRTRNKKHNFHLLLFFPSFIMYLWQVHTLCINFQSFLEEEVREESESSEEEEEEKEIAVAEWRAS